MVILKAGAYPTCWKMIIMRRFVRNRGVMVTMAAISVMAPVTPLEAEKMRSAVIHSFRIPGIQRSTIQFVDDR